LIFCDLHKKLNAVDGEMDLTIKTTIEKGQLVTLYGPSGAGKTSTLRMLAGLLIPDNGQIVVDGSTWFDRARKIHLKPQERKIGFVFQDFALFPNMTVLQNLEFALNKSVNERIIRELIDITELGDLQHFKPETLSGGQKQRVALARALVQRPEILLLDEPLSALDNSTRNKLQDYILSLHRHYRLTTILISHDIGEIIKLSDYVLEIRDGKIFQQGKPFEIFMAKQFSGKYQMVGEVLNIQKEEVIYIVTVICHSSIIKVVAQQSEIADLKKGDKVIIAAKAFNPVLYKAKA